MASVTVRIGWDHASAPQTCVKLKRAVCGMPNDNLCLACERQAKVSLGLLFLEYLRVLGLTAIGVRHRWRQPK